MMRISKQNLQVLQLYGCSILAVLLGILSSVINTRFLSPSDYGDVKYVQNIANLMAVVLLFGYYMSGARLMALTDDKGRISRIKGAMLRVLGVGILVLMACMPLLYLAHKGSNPGAATLFLYCIPVAMSPLLLNYIEQTTQGDNQIGCLSLARLLPLAIYVPTAFFVYSVCGATPRKMILLQWGIYSLAYVALIISTRPSFKGIKTEWNDLRKENREYGIHLYAGSLVMVATNYLAGISLGYFNPDNTEVGFYTLALTISSPLAALPSIVGTSYFKKFSSQSCIPPAVKRTTLSLALVCTVAFILLIRPVVVFLYTEAYASTGTYACFLAVAYSLHGIGDMYNKFLCSHGKGAPVRNASIASGILKIAGFTALVALFNINGAIITVLLCDSLYCGLLIFGYYKTLEEERAG